MSDTTPSVSILTRLAPLITPRHVAIIGASRTPGKEGNTALRYLKQGGFAGQISPINPGIGNSGGEIEGLTAYASVVDAPGTVDCALFTVPAAATMETVRQCAEAGVRSIIIASTGFAELGTEEGRARQDEIVAIARAADMLVMGPNTNGIFNGSDRFSLGYNVSHGDPIVAGPISVAAHSGALFNGFYPRLRRFGAGLSKFVPVGNEADLTMLDFLDYFIEDPETKVIGLIIEGIGDGARFRELAERARDRGKPVVALKLGTSEAGAGAALAHSSRLAGSARAYDALFRECGVARVPSVEALAGGCTILARRTAQSVEGDQALVCVTGSGAGGALLADYASERHIPLAGEHGEWGGAVGQAAAGLEGAGLVRNPIDLGNLRGHQRMTQLFAAMQADGVTGPTAFYDHLFPRQTMNDEITAMFVERARETATPVVVVTPGGLGEANESVFTDSGIPVFHDMATCFDSLACHYHTLPRGHDGAHDVAPTDTAKKAAEMLRVTLARSTRTVLSEIESAEILAHAGLPVVPSTVVEDVEDALATAERDGFPIVLKALAPDVAHKNVHGLVATHIGSTDSLHDAYYALEKRITDGGFARDRTPIILQPMIVAKAELIIGLTHERDLGPMLVVGLGGVYTEVLNEVELFPVPSTPETIRTHLETTRIGRLLAALTTETAPNNAGVDPLADAACCLETLQSFALACGDAVDAVDINPLLVTDRGCIAVDALITPGTTPGITPGRSN